MCPGLSSIVIVDNKTREGFWSAARTTQSAYADGVHYAPEHLSTIPRDVARSEERLVRLPKFTLRAGREQLPVKAERRGRGGMVSIQGCTGIMSTLGRWAASRTG